MAWFKDKAGNTTYETSSILRVDPNRPPIIGFGTSLSFDGVEDHLIVEDSNSLTSQNSLTISAWFKKESGSSLMGLVGKGTSDSNEEYYLALNNSQIYFDVGAGGGPYIQQNASIKTGEWQHIAAVHNRVNGISSLKIYLDGEDIGGTVINSSATPNNNNHPLTIGVRTSNGLYGQYFKGELDEVQIWNLALDIDEIRSFMKHPLDIENNSYSGLVFYSNFNEGKGLIANDQSGLSQVANLNNMTNSSWLNSTIPLRYTVLENPVAGATITTIPVSDPDTGDTVTLNPEREDVDSFELSHSGVLTLTSTASLDYETDSQYDLDVSANDGKLSVHQQVIIEVQDLPETSGKYALSFDGSDDYIRISDDESLTRKFNMTISAWFKKESGTSLMGIVGKGTSDSNEEYYLALNDSQIYFDVGAEGYIQQNASIKIGQWQHISAVHNRINGISTLKVY